MAVQQPWSRHTFPPPSMPPLTRQPTLGSILSWWSDSNPSGATINLHAAAKPLMKLMYHREALAFMNTVRGSSDIEAKSLPRWKYVSSATKIAILEELKTRARSEEDARVLIHSNMVYTILEIFQSISYLGKSDLRAELKTILWDLASHSKSTSAAVGELLVALLRRVGDSDVNDVALGFDLLRHIAYSPAGADGVVAANAQHYLLDGLRSPSSSIQWRAYELMCALAKNQSTAAAVIALNPCKQLVALSRQVCRCAVDIDEAWVALHVLIAIANWPDGAEAVVAAQVLDHVPKWFASRSSMRQSACQLVEKLAWHKSTAGAVMDPKLCAQLVTILELYPESDAAWYALEALGRTAKWSDGAEAVVAAKVLDHITNSLESRYYSVRQSTCDLLAARAARVHRAGCGTRSAPRTTRRPLKVLLITFCTHPIDHGGFRDKVEDVRESAGKALRAIDDYLASAHTPMEEAGSPTIYVL
ncbi:armadillo-type protein [Mycena latifolia]|nr:armadillo-type protein [Mycena latifolia]